MNCSTERLLRDGTTSGMSFGANCCGMGQNLTIPTKITDLETAAWAWEKDGAGLGLMPGSDYFYPSPLILCIVYAHMHLTWRCVVGTVKITSWDVNVRVVPTAFDKYNESEVLNAVHVLTVGGFWNKSVINDLDHRVNANYTVNVNASRCCTSLSFNVRGPYVDGFNYWPIFIVFWLMAPALKWSKCEQNNGYKFYTPSKGNFTRGWFQNE